MTDYADDYILSHIDPEPDYLRKLDRDTHIRLVNPRMCSGHLQGRVLKMLARMTAPRRALELGTYSGYSALALAEGMPDGSELHTVEIFDELEDFIRSHLAEADPAVAAKITLHIGDALETVPRLGGTFDLVFIDADKRLYPDYYDMLMPMVADGGYIIADNTLWDGHVAAPGRAHDAQTEALRRFNDTVAADPRVETVIIPLRDGLTLLRKIPPAQRRH